MGFEYILVDSKHRKEHETDSKMKVHLSAPIHHAKSVRLVSFSCLNEFFDVTDEKHTITFVSYNCTSNARATPRVVTVAPGLYTISEMITIINTDLQIAYTGTHPIIRNLLNKKSTRHSGPRIA